MATNSTWPPSKYDGSKLTRHDFPSEFQFGAATSAYQVEGAYLQDRKAISNWDAFGLQRPGKIADGSNGCIAIDHYNQYKEDVKLMKKIGLDAYRLSIQWSRILPGGRLSSGVNRDGVKFYSDLIDLLLSEGITPFVTIFHFDIPQCLQDEYDGFLDRQIVVDFAEYADVCFFEFGDRVKNWITINEAWTFTHNGYVTGNFPPAHGSAFEQPSTRNAAVPVPYRGARVSDTSINVQYRGTRAFDTTTNQVNPATEPYIIAHHLLLAHASAVDIYKTRYQAVQGGQIGITNMSTWYEPYNPSSQADIDAASRAVDFMWGWFTEPIVTGDYPSVMRDRVGSRLPIFTPAEKNMLKGSYDFIGLNYYTTNLASYKPKLPGDETTYYTDQEVEFHIKFPDGTPIGEMAASEWLIIVPYGIYKLLTHNAEKYNNPLVYITENGVNEKNDRSLPVTQAIKDDYRIKYYQDHLAFILQARTEASVNVQGFLLWSFFDNYEWAEGYEVRFGLIYVDYVNHMIRYPKNSAIWYMNFLNKKQLLSTTKRQVVVEEIVETDNSVAKRKRNRN